MANVCLKTKSNLEDVCSSMHYTTSSVQTRAKHQCWGGQQALGPVPHGNKGVRKRMNLEYHHDTFRDCTDLEGTPGSYLRLHRFSLRWIFFGIVKDIKQSENFLCEVFWNARPPFRSRVTSLKITQQTSRKDPELPFVLFGKLGVFPNTSSLGNTLFLQLTYLLCKRNF